jgi:hypothetical protein
MNWGGALKTATGDGQENKRINELANAMSFDRKKF